VSKRSKRRYCAKLKTEVKKRDKLYDASCITHKLDYSTANELNDYNPRAIVRGSFESNKR
jgi:hypothetical protein